MRTLIVDDEPLARSRLKRLLLAHPDYACVGEASNGEEALSQVKDLKPDLVLLDIEIPGGDGLSVAEQLNTLQIPPAIIFVTAHPEHALDAYRVSPADYLLKPVDPERLGQSLERIFARKRSYSLENPDSTWVCFKKGETYQRIRFTDVLYFVAEDSLVRLVYSEGEAILEESLLQIEAQYPNDTLRIHRHLVVNRHRISALKKQRNGHVVFIEGSELPLEVSRRKLSDVKAAMQQT